MMSLPKREVWPVMLTPFTDSGAVDYRSLGRLIEWYQKNGADGLFAVCQSSEMFYLSLRERVDVARFVKNHSSLPVIASGHISCDIDDQIEEIQRMADTGADAVVLITNRLACESDEPEVWLKNTDAILAALDDSIPLGLYECPYPYRRLVSEHELAHCAATGRFRFLKDTCRRAERIQKRLDAVKNSPLKLFNANTATLLPSLRAGAAGFSGVMANYHPELYAWLVKNFDAQPEKAEILHAALTMCAYIEKQLYPVSAKVYLKEAGVLDSTYTRAKDRGLLTVTHTDELRQLARLTAWLKASLGIEAA